MAEDIGALAVKIAMDDSTFQQGMKTLKQSMGVIDSSFRESIAGVKNWGSSLDGLKANAQALGDKINVQKQIMQQYSEQLQKSKDNLQANAEKMMDLKAKVESAKTAWQESSKTLGVNDEATLKLGKDYQSLNKQYADSESKVRSSVKSVEGYTIQINNASGKLKSMESDLSGVSRQLDEATKNQSFFGKASEKLGLGMDSLKSAFGAVGIAAGSFLKGAVDSAVAAQKNTEQLTNLLRNQGISAGEAKKDIDSFAGAITKMSAFSAGEAKAALEVLTEKGISASKALGMEGTLANVAAGTNSSLADAADMVANAYNGKTKALTALGILSKAEVKELGDTETATITMADVQDRLNKRFAGAAQTDLQSYSGQMKENQNTIKSATTAIGTSLLPVLAQLADAFLKIITPVANFIKQNPAFTAGLLAIVAIVGTLIGGLSLMSTVITGLGVIAPIFLGVGATAGAMVLPILAVVAAIAAVAALAFIVIKNWASISSFFIKLWTDIKTGTQAAWNSIGAFFTTTWSSITISCTSAFNGIRAFFTNLWSGIKISTENIFNGIKDFFVNTWTSIRNTALSIVTGIMKSISTIFSTQIGAIKVIFASLVIIFQNVWAIIKNVFLGAILLILDLVTGNFSKLRTDAAAIFNNLKDLFMNIWENIKNIFVNALRIIGATLKMEWDGIIAVATLVWNGFKAFMTGLWNGIKSAATGAWNGLKNEVLIICGSISNGAIGVWNGLMTFFRNLPGTMYTLGTNMFTSMKSGISSVVSTIGSTISSGFNAAISFITSLPSKAFGWGLDFIEGLRNGIMSAISGITSAVSNVAESIRRMLHFSTPDEGPLMDYESWMPDFMGGLAKGIEKSKSVVTSAIKSLATDVNIGMKLTPDMAGASVGLGATGSTVNQVPVKQGNTTINFNGNYTFSDKKDINYFMNQAALLVQRKKG